MPSGEGPPLPSCDRRGQALSGADPRRREDSGSFWRPGNPKEDLEADGPETLQDPYSLRCAPQIMGVLSDALAWMRPWVEIEANSANDNPLFAGRRTIP